MNKLIVDRDFMLMMKDTWLARFNSLVSLIGRTDLKFPKYTLFDILKLYQNGYVIIHNVGNDSYTGVKLLEPLCVL